MGKMLSLLNEGGHRATGRVADAVRTAIGNGAHIGELVELMSHGDADVRLRASDVLEKATVQHHDVLAPHKDHLLDLIETATQNEVRWHLAQILTRLDLDPIEVEDLSDIFDRWFRRADSGVVRVAAVQGMADLAFRDPQLVPQALKMIEQAQTSDFPALKARARKLKGPLERLQAAGQD